MVKLNTYLLQTKPVIVRIKWDQALWGYTPHDYNRTKFDLKSGQRFWATRASAKLEDNSQGIMLIVFKSGMLIRFTLLSSIKDLFEFLDDGHGLNTNWVDCIHKFNCICKHTQLVIPKNN